MQNEIFDLNFVQSMQFLVNEKFDKYLDEMRKSESRQSFGNEGTEARLRDFACWLEGITRPAVGKHWLEVVNIDMTQRQQAEC